jgi:hypothetical protein
MQTATRGGFPLFAGKPICRRLATGEVWAGALPSRSPSGMSDAIAPAQSEEADGRLIVSRTTDQPSPAQTDPRRGSTLSRRSVQRLHVGGCSRLEGVHLPAGFFGRARGPNAGPAGV